MDFRFKRMYLNEDIIANIRWVVKEGGCENVSTVTWFSGCVCGGGGRGDHHLSAFTATLSVPSQFGSDHRS